MKAGLALGCTVSAFSKWDRKSYYYPDLPKNYQISQYDQPLSRNGALDVMTSAGAKRVRIRRVHLEEDAGKSLHDGFADSADHSYVDFNRSGVPLIEIVTRPELTSAASAAAFFERLRDILVELGVNGGNLEAGHLRSDANVSLRRVGEGALGTPVEVKNLNSFRYLERALDYEIARQAAVLDEGGRVVRETRLFDAASGRTATMRSKEQADDYRYFPEPDLPPLSIPQERIDRNRARLPELPDARRQRLIGSYGLSEYDAGQVAATPALARFFEAVAAVSENPKAAANWMSGEVARRLKETGAGIDEAGITAGALAGLIAVVDAGTVSVSLAKQVLDKMWGTGRSATEVVEAEHLTRIDDQAALEAVVRQVVTGNPKPVAQFKAGKTHVLGFFVGQVMKATRGQADPELVNSLVRRELGGA